MSNYSFKHVKAQYFTNWFPVSQSAVQIGSRPVAYYAAFFQLDINPHVLASYLVPEAW